MPIQFKKTVKHKHTALLKAAEYKHFMTLRLVNILIVGLFVFFVLGLGFFIYQKVYNTIGQVQAITVLKSELGAEIISFTDLEKTQKAWQEKQADPPTTTVRDPFNSLPLPIVVPTPVATTTEREI